MCVIGADVVACVQSRRRCGSGEPNPGEKFGKAEPIPGIDVADEASPGTDVGRG